MEASELAGLVGLREAGSTRACDLIADQLRVLITSGQIAPGTRLPSERDLAKRFQTSRATLSQALRILAALGLVDIVHGSGVYVSPQPTRLLRSSVELMLSLDRVSMITLAEIRGWIEVAAITRAAETRSDDDVARIRAALETMEAERSSVTAWLVRDGEFHRAIVEATGNAFAAAILSTISDLMNSARHEAYRQAESVPGWFDRREFGWLIGVHRRIADAIATGDAAGAHAAALDHQRMLERNVAQLDPWAEEPRG